MIKWTNLIIFFIFLKILRTDILQDAGESINPEIDIGQVEGGFVMGLGYLLTENIIYDSKSGLTLTHNTSVSND